VVYNLNRPAPHSKPHRVARRIAQEAKDEVAVLNCLSLWVGKSLEELAEESGLDPLAVKGALRRQWEAIVKKDHLFRLREEEL